MAAVDQNSNAVLQGIARHINCLGEDNRNTRKKALESIRNDTINRKPVLESPDLEPIFSEILKPMLKMFSDPVEKCRELSVGIVHRFFEKVSDPEDRLSYVFPVLVQRLGQQEIVEPSEELRLQLVELFSLLVDRAGQKLPAYLDDSVKILQRTLMDPFPDVKKESCKCASKIAKAIPQYFHMVSETLIKPLLMSITHQHSKIRALTVSTIGDVIQYGNGKSVDTVTSHLAQRLFDQVPAVRKAVTQVVGGWLLDLLDRYSFHYKLLPLLLTSITDEQPDICELADSLWHDVGLKYEQENENDFKDKQDFVAPHPEHYPPNKERPNLGCRVLVNRHASKILPGLMRDICDWVVETRVKSAQLLTTLLLNLEDYTTQHIELLLTGLCRASGDEETRVVQDVDRSAELIGYFVKPEVWVKLTLTSLRASQSHCTVLVMAAIIRGSQTSLLMPHVSDICEVLTSPDICHTVQSQMHIQLLNCVEALLKVLGPMVKVVNQQLFDLIVTVMALSSEQVVRDKGNELMEQLSQSQGLQSVAELFQQHTRPLLQSYGESYMVWTNHSAERLIFDTLLVEAGPVVGDLLDEISSIFKCCLHPDKDPEMRLKFFALLSRLVMNAATTLDSKNRFGEFAQGFVKDIILPNCVWRAGRTAGAIRTTAVSCLWAMLQSGVLTKDKLEPVAEELITQITTTMDDDNKSTRLISCRVMTRTFDTMGQDLDQDRLHNLYPELLKRLDDSSDEIRVTVTQTLLAYFDCFKDRYEVDLYRAHLEALYRGLLVHLDDPEVKIQEAVLKVLERAAQLHPAMMLQEVEQVKHKHRSPDFCDRLTRTLLAQKVGDS
ncbi:dynein axonemal assembly factor 5-like [Babylonia areolata]|uniref:dynein axonemal assembly factor 5-like n=1 Tax=Babylonia areolata TaxID=304850 RepID=UPI003FD20C5E